MTRDEEHIVYRRRVLPSGRCKYEKVGRYWDAEVVPFGSHLVTVVPGCRTTVYRIDPARAEVLAACAEIRDELQRAVLARITASPWSPNDLANLLIDKLADEVVRRKEEVTRKKAENDEGGDK
jgi:hypothetical protein